MGYIPQHALKNLRYYSYNSADHSLLSRHVLSHFWNWLITLWPLWVAPNLITLSGLFLVLCNFLTLVHYDPSYLTGKDGPSDTGPPQWIYFTWAAGLFLYQSFDAIDGKQARRTGMAGPLGELFDHGCDALNTTLEVILAARALNLGRSWWTVASQSASLANFYLTTWEEYHTGQLYLGVFNGPVEGVLIICAIFIVSGVYGPSIWDTSLPHLTGLEKFPFAGKPFPDIRLNEAFMFLGGVGLAFNIVVSYTNVLKSRKTTQKSSLAPLLYLIPFFVPALLHVVWLSYPSYDHSAIVHTNLLVPFMISWGLQFAHHVGRIILAHVTRESYPWWDWMWIWNMICALDASLPWLLHHPPIIQSSPAQISLCVYTTLTLSLVSYIRFCVLVIQDITEYLGIACFTVRKRDAKGVWRKTKDVPNAASRLLENGGVGCTGRDTNGHVGNGSLGGLAKS